MSTERRIQQLIGVLTQGTSAGLLQWQPTVDENAFRLASPTANVRVARSEGFNQETGVPFIVLSLHVLNDRGRVIEEYHPSEGREAENLDELFTLARRSACKTDELLDKLVTELSGRVEK
jgi:hypothetical protein